MMNNENVSFWSNNDIKKQHNSIRKFLPWFSFGDSVLFDAVVFIEEVGACGSREEEATSSFLLFALIFRDIEEKK